MTPNSPLPNQSQKSKSHILGLLAMWIVFSTWFGFVYESVAPQIYEYAFLRQRLKEEVPTKSFDEFYKAISTDPRLRVKVETFNQDREDIVSRAKKDWDDTKQQRPLVYGFLNFGCFIFTFGVKPYNILGASVFWPGIVCLLLLLIVVLAILLIHRRTSQLL